MTYRCCQHCVDPCPAVGHTMPCGDCRETAIGRQVAKETHFPPGKVRDWPIPGRRSNRE